MAGVGISHPDRLIYPDEGISKIQLARYFEQVADWMLPHLVISKNSIGPPCRSACLGGQRFLGPGAR